MNVSVTGISAENSSGFFSLNGTNSAICPRVISTNFPKLPEQSMPELSPAKRARSFKEVELGFSAGQAQSESARCLECGCSAYFDCDLRRYARISGSTSAVFRRSHAATARYRSHPFIALDANKCIACGRCVRTCSDILQVSALGFVYRGFRRLSNRPWKNLLHTTASLAAIASILAPPAR